MARSEGYDKLQAANVRKALAANNRQFLNEIGQLARQMEQQEADQTLKQSASQISTLAKQVKQMASQASATLKALCFCRPRASRDKKWQGRQDSNPQPAVLETAALPIELLPCANLYSAVERFKVSTPAVRCQLPPTS